MNRRRALTLIGAVGVTGLAGCTGENGEFNYAASPAMIPEGEREGYEAEEPREIEFNETVGFSGVERDVHISTWSAAYASPEDQTSVFVFSTPNVEVAGQSVNPLARLEGADLIARVIDEGLGQAGGDMALQEIEQEDEIAIPVLGEERTVPVFSAVLEAQGSSSSQIEGAQNGEIPIQLYLLSITHGEDVLLSVGFHPAAVDNRADIESLLSSIEHPAETSAESNTTDST